LEQLSCGRIVLPELRQNLCVDTHECALGGGNWNIKGAGIGPEATAKPVDRDQAIVANEAA